MSYRPIFEGPIEGYVVNQLTRNFWKVQSTMEKDDVMQEARLVFLRCSRRYAGAVTQAPHFMALFKTAWRNRFLELAAKDSALRAAIVFDGAGPRDEDGDPIAPREPVGDVDNDGFLSSALRQAPQEVATVLRLFLDAPQELLELALGTWGSNDAQRNTGSARINELLGFAPGFDAVGTVRSYLSSAA